MCAEAVVVDMSGTGREFGVDSTVRVTPVVGLAASSGRVTPVEPVVPTLPPVLDEDPPTW